MSSNTTEHGEHFNESIVNEVILEDMKKNPYRSYEISSGNGDNGRVRCYGTGHHSDECL